MPFPHHIFLFIEIISQFHITVNLKRLIKYFFHKKMLNGSTPAGVPAGVLFIAFGSSNAGMCIFCNYAFLALSAMPMPRSETAAITTAHTAASPVGCEGFVL